MHKKITTRSGNFFVLIWLYMTPKTYVFFGIVGAGKGTQIDLLKKLITERDPSHKIVYAYPGLEYRTLISNGSFTGSLIKDKLEAGQLQPDFLTISIFGGILSKEMTADCHLIADGYPRTLPQADAFAHAIEFYKRSDVSIIYIEVSKEEVIKRMKLRGRSDDTDEGINRRFWEYETNVIPAMEDLKKRGYALHKVNGEQSVEAVHEEVKKVLGL